MPTLKVYGISVSHFPGPKFYPIILLWRSVYPVIRPIYHFVRQLQVTETKIRQTDFTDGAAKSKSADELSGNGSSGFDLEKTVDIFYSYFGPINARLA